jgi:hypothetical protein
VRLERPSRAAKLTGQWVRKSDGITFSLADDGFRVVGQATGTEDYVYYEVTLEWKDEKTLTGFGVLKENLDDCKFEASVKWTLDVVDGQHLKGMCEEVGWNDQCQEADRAWVDHVFEKKQ